MLDQQASDTLTVTITESATVAVPVGKTATDTLTVTLDDQAGVERVTVRSPIDTLTVTIDDQATRAGLGPTFGTWTSPPLPLPAGPIAGSVVTWDALTPAGTAVTVETSVDNGASWQPAANTGPVARLPTGTSTARAVLARATLTRATANDPSPRLRRVELRVGIDSSRPELLPLGVFTLTDVEIVDGPGGIEIEVSGADLARRVSRNRWDDTFVVEAGTNTGDAIKAVVANRIPGPGLRFNFASTPRTTQRLFFGEQADTDPWGDVQDLADAIGHDVFFDPLGICTLRPEPDPDLADAVWTFTDLTNPTVTELVRRVSDEDTYNKVIVTGEGSGNDVPARGVAVDDDPASPTYYLGPYGTVTFTFRSPMVASNEQAQDAAEALLRRRKGATETVELSVVPHPAIEPGDVVAVVRGRSRVEGRFLVDALTIPLGPEEPMRIVGRRQRL